MSGGDFSNSTYADPGQVLFGILTGTLASSLMGLAARPPREVSMKNTQLAGTVPLELVGTSVADLTVALNLMEDSMEFGEKARLQIITDTLQSQEELNFFYLDMVNAGFHLSRPRARMVRGFPSVEMVLRKGSPILAALIPLLPTAIISGLVAFGITRIGAIANALIPLVLVTLGGVVVLAGVLTRKPAMEAVKSVAGRYLARTVPLESLPAAKGLIRAKEITLTRAEGRTAELGKPVTLRQSDYPSIWEVANTTLFGWSQTAPKKGEGYHKVDFKVEYENGETYSGRYDLVHHTAEPPDLARHMFDFVRFAAGKWPGSLAQERYAAFQKEKAFQEAQPRFVKFLETYEIGSLPIGRVPQTKNPKDLPALQRQSLDILGKYEIVEVHSDGDLTVRVGEHAYVVTTKGEIFAHFTPQQAEERARDSGGNGKLFGGASPAVIPDEPSPMPRLKGDPEFIADSPEFLAATMDGCGWRKRIEQEFQTAIKRVRS